MKWVIFTGTWRITNSEVENDVRTAVREVLSVGNGIVTGGATGVDYFVMDEYFKLDQTCRNIRIFLPARLTHFIEDYRKNWKHHPITDKEIDQVEKVLIQIKSINPAAVYEVKKDTGDISQYEYDMRHNEEVTFSDEVYAFQVNNSTGTQDTVDKARDAGLPIVVHKKYSI